MKSTSWQKASKWYQENVGEEGHYYHQHVILPNLLPLLDEKTTLLDLACGQGVLGRKTEVSKYVGVDLAPSLIQYAKKNDKNRNHLYQVQDVTKPFDLKEKFNTATCILAIQNFDPLLPFMKNAHKHLETGGRFLIVMNHPCFRIPRQSSWGVDEPKKIQYRRIDRYLSPLTIPIKTHPGKPDETETISFHRPISTYVNVLNEAGFVVEQMDEWISNKESTGSKAKMENRAREEFPLFLFIKAKKV